MAGRSFGGFLRPARMTTAILESVAEITGGPPVAVSDVQFAQYDPFTSTPARSATVTITNA